ncbi:hypothetical protein [Streptomyces sp. NPDC048192]|uniref:hypothetical protein n=1 Tax=Streptomyces sp. NPDC048192 TaxID=3365510 RepID=UPI003723A187
MTDTDGRTGEQLAEKLLSGVGDERMRAATRLLGAHRDGYWLRRLLAEEADLSRSAGQPVIDRSQAPSVDWDAIGDLLLSRSGALKASVSEMAILEVAVSLVVPLRVQLGTVIQVVDDNEFRLIQRALEEAR